MVAESQTERLVLLPSMRFGRLYNELTDGKKVYLSTEGQFLCEHGELASNISYWCAMEKKKAKVDGLCPPPRGGHSNPSICTCQTTEGMNVTLAESITPPTRPSSLSRALRLGVPGATGSSAGRGGKGGGRTSSRPRCAPWRGTGPLPQRDASTGASTSTVQGEGGSYRLSCYPAPRAFWRRAL